MINRVFTLVFFTVFSMHMDAQSIHSQILPLKHLSNITKIIYSSNIPFIYTASEDKTIKLWDATSKELLRTLYGHQDKITDLCINRENTILFSGDKSGMVFSWNTNTGNINKTCSLKDTITALLYVPYKNLLIVALQNKTITLLNATTLDILKTISTSPYRVIRLLSSKEKDEVIAGFTGYVSDKKTGTGTIQVLDISTYKLYPVSTYAESLTDLTYSPDSSKLVTTSEKNNMIRIWDTQRWIEEKSIKNPVTPSMAFVSDNNKKVTIYSSETNELNIYRTTGELILNIKINNGKVIMGEMNDESILVCTHTGILSKYDYNGHAGSVLYNFVQASKPVMTGEYSAFHKSFILGYASETNKIFNLFNEQCYTLPDSFKTATAGISCSPTQPLSLIFYLPAIHYNESSGTSTYFSKQILINMNDKNILHTYSYTMKYITSSCLATNYLFTGFNDGTLEVFDIKNKITLTTLKISPFDVVHIYFNNNNSALFIQTIDNKVQQYQYTPPKTLKMVQTIQLSNNETMIDIKNTYLLTNKHYINMATHQNEALSIMTGKWVQENQILFISSGKDSLLLKDISTNQILWQQKLLYENPVSLIYDSTFHWAGVIYSSATVHYFNTVTGNDVGTLFINDDNSWMYIKADEYDVSPNMLPHILSQNGSVANVPIKQHYKEKLMQQTLFAPIH